METKFTKEPWEWRKPNGVVKTNRIYSVSTDCQVAHLNECHGAQEIEANARLISAAPELYEACEMQQRLIDDMARFVGKMALQDYALFNEAPIKARAALAKAKGERS